MSPAVGRACRAHVRLGRRVLEFALSGRGGLPDSDVNMPRLSGLELQSRLGEKGRTPPIIFITAYPEERARARALQAGAICYLDKPFDSATLIECLDLALRRESDGVTR